MRSTRKSNGSLLKKIREQNKRGIIKQADSVGINYGILSLAENDKCISRNSAIKLSEVYHVPVDNFTISREKVIPWNKLLKKFGDISRENINMDNLRRLCGLICDGRRLRAYMRGDYDKIYINTQKEINSERNDR